MIASDVENVGSSLWRFSSEILAFVGIIKPACILLDWIHIGPA